MSRNAIIAVSAAAFIIVLFFAVSSSLTASSSIKEEEAAQKMAASPSSPSASVSSTKGKIRLNDDSAAVGNEVENIVNKGTIISNRGGSNITNHCAASSPMHATCRKWFQSMGKRFFRIHHIHSHDFSVERKVVRLFGPSLAKLFCSSSSSSSSLSATTDTGGGVRKATVVDIGVNDAEDIPYWFDKFGSSSLQASIFANEPTCRRLMLETASSSSSSQQRFEISFRLFEPQAMYKSRIETVLKAELRKPNVVSAVSVTGHFDAVAVGSDKLHGSIALFYGKGEQASLGSTGKHAAAGKPVEVKVGALSKMLAPSWKSELSGRGGGEIEEQPQQQQQAALSSSSNDNPILYMKVDCEGADPTIIVDSEALFAAHRVHLLVFELHKNERGFPKRFVDSAAMLRSHGYDVYLIGRCQSQDKNKAGGVFFVKVDEKVAAAWTPVLEAGIAISPQLQKLMGGSSALGRYFGGAQLQDKSRYVCGASWQWVPQF